MLNEQRSHANGWVTTVLRHDDGLVEGYLWDQHRQPLARQAAQDARLTQQRLDEMVTGRGHTCSPACGVWTACDAT